MPFLVRVSLLRNIAHAMIGRDAIPAVANRILVACYLLHYCYRSLIYPQFVSPTSRMPLVISFFAFCYTFINGYLQAYDLIFQQDFVHGYENSFQFWIGCALGMFGFAIGGHGDHALLKLKRNKEANGSDSSYQIPHGGLFEYVSSPHHFGEILEWTGFCIACNFSIASVSFVVWTAAKLVLRAYAAHRWYHDKFPDEYPALNRKVILPAIF